MALDRQIAEQVAHLARLKLEPERAADVTDELSRILDLIEQIDQVDTTHTVPMAHPLDLAQPLREDRVTNEPDRERLMGNAPDQMEGLFRVPRSVE
jgi:aspartyl-tRNA(Asn)/glutamyl-tRNA(Gln) amidotransferase subunit C